MVVTSTIWGAFTQCHKSHIGTRKKVNAAHLAKSVRARFRGRPRCQILVSYIVTLAVIPRWACAFYKKLGCLRPSNVLAYAELLFQNSLLGRKMCNYNSKLYFGFVSVNVVMRLTHLSQEVYPTLKGPTSRGSGLSHVALH